MMAAALNRFVYRTVGIACALAGLALYADLSRLGGVA
jgi:hypothetical protein